MKPTSKFEKLIYSDQSSNQAINEKMESLPPVPTPQESRDVILQKIHHLLEQAYKATEPFHSNN
jgi:hypothetical protein